MDSYEIYKQLTIGARFTKKPNKVFPKIKNETLEIKKEKNYQGEHKLKCEENNTDEPLQIIDGISSGESCKVKPKKKLSEEEQKKLQEVERVCKD